MFSSVLLRKLGVKQHIAISLIIAVIFGGCLFYKLVIEKQQTFISENNLTLTKEVDGKTSLILSATSSNGSDRCFH